MTDQVNRSFLVFSVGVFSILLLPELFREGMFMDGLIYATLGHNMAHGIGTLWLPQFSETVMREFHEHPPLAFGIQSAIYRVFGSAFYIEKIFSLLTALATAAVTVKFWRLLADKAAVARGMYWLPVFLWIAMPHCFWAYKNNMLENTMGLFSIMAAYLLVSMVVKRKKWPILHIIAAAVMLAGSFLTKGFPGLYPLGVLFLYFLAYRDARYPFKKMVLHTVMLFAGLGAIAVLVLQYPPAAENIERYVNSQVMGSLQGKRVVVSSRWHIMLKLLNELILGLVLLALVFSIAWRKGLLKLAGSKPVLRNALFFLLIGLSASAPIMVSPKQLSFYVVPSLPYFALAISTILASILGIWLQKIRPEKIGFKTFGFVGWLLIAAAIILSGVQAGTPSRDGNMLSDVDAVAAIVPVHTTIELSQNLAEDWSLMAYFQRKYFISLDPSGRERAFLLLQKGDAVPAAFEPVEIDLHRYQLARRIDNE